MKKTALIVVITLLVQVGYSQGLQKGNLFGLHTATITLNPDVKIDQFKTFFTNKVLPEYEKSWTGLKGYLVQSFKFKNKFAIIWLFESVDARNKYFNADGTANDLEKQAYKKVESIEKALKKYGTYTVKYEDADDWIVL